MSKYEHLVTIGHSNDIYQPGMEQYFADWNLPMWDNISTIGTTIMIGAGNMKFWDSGNECKKLYKRCTPYWHVTCKTNFTWKGFSPKTHRSVRFTQPGNPSSCDKPLSLSDLKQTEMAVSETMSQIKHIVAQQWEGLIHATRIANYGRAQFERDVSRNTTPTMQWLYTNKTSTKFVQ